MGSQFAAAAPVLIEPGPVQDIVVNDIVAIEDQNGFVRMTFCAERSDLLGGERAVIERVIVARMVMTQPDFQRMLAKCMRYGMSKTSPNLLLQA